MLDRNRFTDELEAEEQRLLGMTLSALRDEELTLHTEEISIRDSIGLEGNNYIDDSDWITETRLRTAIKILEIIHMMFMRQDLNRHIGYREEKEVDIIRCE